MRMWQGLQSPEGLTEWMIHCQDGTLTGLLQDALVSVHLALSTGYLSVLMT